VFEWASVFYSKKNINLVNLDDERVDILGSISSSKCIKISSQHTLSRGDEKELITSLFKFEFDIFQKATKDIKLNVFELVKAADYWDMQRLSSSLALYVVFELVECNFDVDRINLFLFKNVIFFPFEFAPRVLYLLLLKRHIASKCFFNIWAKIDNVYEQRSINFSDFLFLYSIENGDFIKYDRKNEQLMHCLSYKDAGFNVVIQQKVRDIMSNYLDKVDLDDSIVAGGIFWDYENESHFAKTYPLLFDVYKSNQDVDVFILDDDEHERYIHYIYKMKNHFNKTFEKDDKMEIEDETDYGVNSFKIIEPNGLIVNFIFVDKTNYSSLSAMVLETFDYSMVKTYYSYKNNALYMPVEIFNQYELMCQKFGKTSRRVDVFSQTSSNASFVYYKRMLCELLSFDFSFPEKSKKFIMGFMEIKREAFCSEYEHSLNCISNFLRRILPRIIKYCFKNGFVQKDDALLVFERLNLFFQVFGVHFNDRYFKFTHGEIFDCIIKYVLKTNKLSLLLN
jgi:hypothetical protein